MSLGWLNLQDYLGANAGNVDDQATKLDEATFAPAPQANGTQPASMGYGEYLARKRTAATEEGAAGLMGGDATDVMLARKGKSRFAGPTSFADPAAAARQRMDNQKREADYWAQQSTRNKSLAEQYGADRKRQDDSVTAAKKAMEDRAGGPGYRAYSDAVRNSYDKSRGRQVRTVSKEEADKWTL